MASHARQSRFLRAQEVSYAQVLNCSRHRWGGDRRDLDVHGRDVCSGRDWPNWAAVRLQHVTLAYRPGVAALRAAMMAMLNELEQGNGSNADKYAERADELRYSTAATNE